MLSFSYFTPRKLFETASRWLGLTRILTLLTLGMGAYMALFASPPDYQQGEAVRIMYVHVPASWLALSIYSLMTALSILGLAGRFPVAHIIVKAAAPLGAAFTFLSLITGMIWGKPMWGAWWVWDARLTSALVLFFLYGGYILLMETVSDKEQGTRLGACLIILGFVNIPIIKWSVEWWNTLHQPASLMRFGSPALPNAMITPLLLMFMCFLSCFVWGLFLRIQSELLERRIQSLARDENRLYKPLSAPLSSGVSS